MDSNLARIGGPVKKQSAWVKKWRTRWLTIDADRITFFSEDNADGSASQLDEIDRTELPQAFVLRRPTVVIELDSITAVFAVPEVRFGRPHAFVLCYRAGRETIALQAPSDERRRDWLEAFQEELARRREAPHACPAKVETLEPTRVPHAAPVRPKARGKPPGPPPPGKGRGAWQGKGKGNDSADGKGKGKAPPPPSTAKGKGKSPPPQGPVLPINKKLQVRALDQGIDLNETVFRDLLDDNAGAEESATSQSSSDDSGADRMTELFRATFTPRPLRSERAQKALSAMECRRSNKRKEVLDNRVAQNAEIVLRRMAIGVDELKEAADKLDFEVALTEEFLDRLREALPAECHFRRLLQFQHEEAGLRSIEQKLLRLAPINRLDSRLRAISLKKGLEIRKKRLLDEVKSVRSACSELMESSILRDILRAVLRVFNFANHGVERLEKDTVRGFDITTALKVADLKSEIHSCTGEGPINGLHFVVSQVSSQKPLLGPDALKHELRFVFKASSLDLGEISKEARTFHGQAQFLLKELTEHRRCYESESCENMPAIPQVPTTAPPTTAGGTLTPLPMLSPVPEDRTARRPEISSIIIASPRKLRVRVGAKVSKILGHTGVDCPRNVSWIAEIKKPRVWRSRIIRWRRVFINAASQSLEIRGSVATASLALCGARVEPFSSPHASPVAVALAPTFPYGFEISLARSRKKRRFTCGSPDELERWLELLRRHSGILQTAEHANATCLQSCFRGTPIQNMITEEIEECETASDTDSHSASTPSCPRSPEISPQKSISCPEISLQKCRSPQTREEDDRSRTCSDVSLSESDGINDADIPELPACSSIETCTTRTPSSAGGADRLVSSVEVHTDGSKTEQSASDSETTASSTGPCVSQCRPVAVPQLNLAMMHRAADASCPVDAIGETGSMRRPAVSSATMDPPVIPRLNLHNMVDSTCAGTSQSQSGGFPESCDVSDYASSASDTEGERAAPPTARLPTARLSVVQKLERLREHVANVDVEVQSKVREAAFQAAQMMRYFGKSVPQLADEPSSESLEQLGKDLHEFLISVNAFLVRVDMSWRDMERSQQLALQRSERIRRASTPRLRMPRESDPGSQDARRLMTAR